MRDAGIWTCLLFSCFVLYLLFISTGVNVIHVILPALSICVHCISIFLLNGYLGCNIFFLMLHRKGYLITVNIRADMNIIQKNISQSIWQISWSVWIIVFYITPKVTQWKGTAKLNLSIWGILSVWLYSMHFTIIRLYESLFYIHFMSFGFHYIEIPVSKGFRSQQKTHITDNFQKSRFCWLWKRTVIVFI